ncbi:hypothetical protein P171DRAFT_485969 [Karstenula rhodostoma CBS 690.94]|uniref:Uncharacterized protein n=1 Tax=Karstenula rhodostoma CBS 690.94 TaxID=1392251 RepID=A0A9P4PKD3_9PLEO|nr:hypothetical protein P171DRAFT_485969 [Karstenula rhodostoma CBS 690.94]
MAPMKLKRRPHGGKVIPRVLTPNCGKYSANPWARDSSSHSKVMIHIGNAAGPPENKLAGRGSFSLQANPQSVDAPDEVTLRANINTGDFLRSSSSFQSAVRALLDFEHNPHSVLYHHHQRTDMDRTKDRPLQNNPKPYRGEIRWPTGPASCIGNLFETHILDSLEKQCKPPSNYRLIPSFDFEDCDVFAFDISQCDPKDPFPDVPLSDFRRLAWAWRHINDDIMGVLCDIKSGPPQFHWLKASAQVYFSRINGSDPDTIYAIPRLYIQRLRDARWQRRRMYIRSDFLMHFPALAPFALAEGDLAQLFTQLLSDDPGPPPGTPVPSSSVILARPQVWADTVRVPIRKLFNMRSPKQKAAFQAFQKLHESLFPHPSLRPHSNHTMEIHRSPTQPLGGDYVVRFDGFQIIVQDKNTSQSQDWFRPTSYFHALFQHRLEGNPLDNALFVSHAPQAGKLFPYENLAGELKQHLVDTAMVTHDRMGNLLGNIVNEDVELEPMIGNEREELEDLRNARSELKEYQTFWKLANHLAMHHYDVANTASKFDLVFVYLNWDQNHPDGDMFVVLHDWTAEERLVFERSGRLPVDLVRLARERRRGIILRHYCRGYRQHASHECHLPMEQREAELPVTAQRFMLVGAPDKNVRARLPPNLLLLPSQFINFPELAKKEWARSAVRVNAETLPTHTLCLLVGHTQPTESFKTDQMLEQGLRLANFWLPPEHVLSNLSRILKGAGQVVHPEVPESSLDTFDAAEYLVGADAVLRASLDHGTMRDGDDTEHRTTGFYNKIRKGNR